MSIFTPREMYLMEQAFSEGTHFQPGSRLQTWLDDCVADGGITAAMVLRSDADRLHGEPVGLPPVTSKQVLEHLNRLEIDILVDSIGASCALAEWFNNPNRHQKSTSGDSSSEKTVRQYYYRTNGCTADTPGDPDCVCWHDQGAGPLPSLRETKASGYKWRGKPQKSTSGDNSSEKPTMHPDLLQLAGMRPYEIEHMVKGIGDDPLVYAKPSGGACAVRKAHLVPEGTPSFTVTEIALARRWLLDNAPDKPTMHPDLEWLSQLPPERFQYIPRKHGDNRPLAFYRYSSLGGYYPDRIGWVVSPTKVPNGVETFTLTEIEQARRHLEKVDRHVAAASEGTKSFKERINAMSGPWAGEFDAQRKVVLHPDNDPYIDAYVLGLNNLPDYETWFEVHGGERTVKHQLHPLQEATVHELYTHFRARLLDELHQAGVIGETP